MEAGSSKPAAQLQSSGLFTREQLREATRVLRAACTRAAVFGHPPPARITSARISQLRLSFVVDHSFDVAFKWSEWEEGPGQSRGRTPYLSNADLRETANRQLALANRNAHHILAQYWPNGLSIGFGDNQTRRRLGRMGPSLIEVCQCEECGGEGNTQCTHCGGFGSVWDSSCHCSSSNCRCSGYRASCSWCHGSGNRPCDPCDSTGEVHRIGTFWLFHCASPDVICVFEEDESDFALLTEHVAYQSMLAHSDLTLDWQRVTPEDGFVARFESEGILTPAMIELQVGGQIVSVASATPHDLSYVTHIATRLVTEFDLKPAWQQRVPLLFHLLPSGAREERAMRFLEQASRSPGLIAEVKQPRISTEDDVVRRFAEYARTAALLRSIRPVFFCFSVLTLLLLAWPFGLSVLRAISVSDSSMAVLSHPGVFLALCALSIVPTLQAVHDNQLPEPLRFLWLWHGGWQWIPALVIPFFAPITAVMLLRSIEHLRHLS